MTTKRVRDAAESLEVEALEPLQAFRLPNGNLIGICDREDFYQRMNETYPDDIIYYVLANTEAEITVEEYEYTYVHKVKKKIRRLKVLKVVRNTVGMTVREIDPSEEAVPLGLADSADFFTIFLPKIPWVLLHKVEAFLRRVDEELHSEAIVLLSYDPDIGGSDGWGVLIPEQENNGGHCKYHPETVIAHKSDRAEIVGSIHSHPGMPAFASHIDHSDQEGLDGIHITMGWRGRHGPIEYHCEFQQMGKHWDVDAGVIFEPVTGPEAGSELDEWIARVSFQDPKAPSKSPSTSSGTHTKVGTNVDAKRDPLTLGVWEYFRQHSEKAKRVGVETEAAERFPSDAWVYGAILSADMHHISLAMSELCPFCSSVLLQPDVDGGVCGICYNLLIVEPYALQMKYGVQKHRIREDALKDWEDTRKKQQLTDVPFSHAYRYGTSRTPNMKGLVFFDLRMVGYTNKDDLPTMEDTIVVYVPAGTYLTGDVPPPPVTPSAEASPPAGQPNEQPPDQSRPPFELTP